ncbi:uncharacterized protein LOC131219221 [Magnolia sinica]|uniref:uncharacterized protein LOC131219221 n=1 Tax=Magnolia sinica TaxID=86752 RepID=UPI002657E89E|nr:uncharacterized protein LOC131219221 [Magnolia sinica]XP_058070234.1 uncharacterized protein LOC131219221 [Magnolia sinica]XP_058070235.1 uncharacterized protein LOC131219221 [Magnolia sinica]XP_058070236.1 uncharacterized protein LOC131219221 [Magnolia sinica]XP_058070237.1 uncharacterized protein LOC131219221 [Magnolia sinica]XP_058070238.1 uncharacterized protein LOC131219221 [Magnolia sinica]XP_058070239.1 uncharacterized protein LOC131219221 [Magnolia sinica]XP_058070240.1 uncharacte
MEEAIVSVSPERIKPGGGNLRRNSTGKTITRSSLSSSNSEQKVLPHYLRASTSSCHDFCKYGRKHAFEAKEKRPITRTVVRNTEASLEGQNQIKTVNLGERKKKPVMKGMVASEPKAESFDKPKVTKKKVLSPVKKIEILAKPAIVLKPKPTPMQKPTPKPKLAVAKVSSSPSNVSRVGLNARRNSETNASNASGGSIGRSSEKKPLHTSGGSIGRSSEKKPLHTSGGLNGMRNSDSKKVKNMGLPKLLQKKELKPPVTSLSPKPSAISLASLKPLKYGNSKMASPVNNQGKFRRSEPNYDEIKEKTLYVIEPEPENSSLEPVRQESHSDQSSPQPSLSSPLFPSVPSSPLLSSHEEEEEEEDEGEEGEEEEESAESDSTLGEAEDSDSEWQGTENKNHVEILKGGQKRLSSAMIHPEDKDCSPQKLKFRRGKVISLQSENNGPRKLRFRKGRVVGETPNGKAEVGRRSFRRKRDLGGDSNGTDAEARTVVLRHQDVQGRKEEQGLLNEVIEVTASKLVETRKSKVKALVGAFETVISLQESKPATAG